MVDRFVYETECRNITGISKQQRHREMAKGLFPKKRMVTDRKRAWLESELEAWVKSREEFHGVDYS